MKYLYESVVNFFIQDDWNYTEIEAGESVSLEIKMENSNYTCYAIVDDEDNIFKFYSTSPLKTPKKKLLQIAELLTRANYGLTLGNFEMDFEDGEVRYKTSILVGDRELDYPVIKGMVYLNLFTIDKYLPAIMKVIYTNISPEEAITQIEQVEEKNQEAA
jgi:hypothetical protein